MKYRMASHHILQWALQLPHPHQKTSDAIEDQCYQPPPPTTSWLASWEHSTTLMHKYFSVDFFFQILNRPRVLKHWTNNGNIHINVMQAYLLNHSHSLIHYIGYKITIPHLFSVNMLINIIEPSMITDWHLSSLSEYCIIAIS